MFSASFSGCSGGHFYRWFPTVCTLWGMGLFWGVSALLIHYLGLRWTGIVLTATWRCWRGRLTLSSLEGGEVVGGCRGAFGGVCGLVHLV